MEKLTITGIPKAYDEIVHNGVEECGDMHIAYKPHAMKPKDGKPAAGGVAVGFTAMIDGKPVKVQAVTSAKLFIQAAHAVLGWEQRALAMGKQN